MGLALRAMNIISNICVGPIDGHHVRVDVLKKTVANGMRFVDELRKRGHGRANAADGRPRIPLRPRIRREEPVRRVYLQPHADRAWQTPQTPPQPYYSYSARVLSITVVFLKLAVCTFTRRYGTMALIGSTHRPATSRIGSYVHCLQLSGSMIPCLSVSGIGGLR